MKPFRIFSVVALLSGLAFSSGAFAVIDDDAAVVTVRASCGEDNCFTNLVDLTNWLKDTRMPNAASPVVVNIGPGTFDTGSTAIDLHCDPTNNYVGYVSFVGAGRQQTIISGPNGITVEVNSCTKIDFSNLAIRSYNMSGGGIRWIGGGDSTWSNVDVIAQYYGWTDVTCGASRGNHYWFGSRIIATDFFGVAIAYNSACDVNWFYGTEISETANTYLGSNGLTVLQIYGLGEAHVYGSAIRANANKTATGGSIRAVTVSDGAQVHIHGTGIDVISSVQNNIEVLKASTGGMIHANVSSYNLSTPSGTVTRIKKDTDVNTHVHAPYLWEHIPDPTTIPNFTSVSGADMTTLTTGTSDGHPHVVVYDPSCTSRWYDTTDKLCKP
jgi:hypothetical protein